MKRVVLLVLLALLTASAWAAEAPIYNPLYGDSVRVGGSTVWMTMLSGDSSVTVQGVIYLDSSGGMALRGDWIDGVDSIVGTSRIASIGGWQGDADVSLYFDTTNNYWVACDTAGACVQIDSIGAGGSGGWDDTVGGLLPIVVTAADSSHDTVSINMAAMEDSMEANLDNLPNVTVLGDTAYAFPASSLYLTGDTIYIRFHGDTTYYPFIVNDTPTAGDVFRFTSGGVFALLPDSTAAGASGDDVRAEPDSGSSPADVPSPFWIYGGTGIMVYLVNGDSLEVKFDSAGIGYVSQAVFADSSGATNWAHSFTDGDHTDYLQIGGAGGILPNDSNTMAFGSTASPYSYIHGVKYRFLLDTNGTPVWYTLNETAGPSDSGDVLTADYNSSTLVWTTDDTATYPDQAVTADSALAIEDGAVDSADLAEIYVDVDGGTPMQADWVFGAFDLTGGDSADWTVVFGDRLYATTSTDPLRLPRVAGTIGQILAIDPTPSGHDSSYWTDTVAVATLATDAEDVDTQGTDIRAALAVSKTNEAITLSGDVSGGPHATAITTTIGQHTVDTSMLDITNLGTGGQVLSNATGGQMTWITGGSGETNTLSDTGTFNGTEGFGLAGGKTGVSLKVKGIIEGANVTITADGDSAYSIASSGGSGYWTLSELSADTTLRWIQGADTALTIELDPTRNVVAITPGDLDVVHSLALGDTTGTDPIRFVLQTDSNVASIYPGYVAFTKYVTMGGKTITHLPDPANDSEAVPLLYLQTSYATIANVGNIGDDTTDFLRAVDSVDNLLSRYESITDVATIGDDTTDFLRAVDTVDNLLSRYESITDVATIGDDTTDYLRAVDTVDNLLSRYESITDVATIGDDTTDFLRAVDTVDNLASRYSPLVNTDSTGTLNLVRATSPSITTPTIVTSITLPAEAIGPADIDLTATVWDFGAATSLEVPNGAAPTVNATGEIGQCTDSADALVFYDGAVAVRKPSWDHITFTVMDPQNLVDSYFQVFHFDSGYAPRGATITRIAMNSSTTETAILRLYKDTDEGGIGGTLLDTLYLNTDTRVRVDSANIQVNAITQGDFIFAAFASGTPEYLNVEIWYYLKE